MSRTDDETPTLHDLHTDATVSIANVSAAVELDRDGWPPDAELSPQEEQEMYEQWLAMQGEG